MSVSTEQIELCSQNIFIAFLPDYAIISDCLSLACHTYTVYYIMHMCNVFTQTQVTDYL